MERVKTKILLFLFLPLLSFAQPCVNDSCFSALQTVNCEARSFCNINCTIGGTSGMNDTVGFGLGAPCYDNIRHDAWFFFDYPVSGSGHLAIDVEGGMCESDNPIITQYGPQEGWLLTLWQGTTCDTSNIVWSTRCYWLTDITPGVITEYDVGVYDPSRQEWHIVFEEAVPGTRYWVQLDGLNWCLGCADFKWCSINPLPVDFLHFSGYKNRLIWTTGVEVDNDRFEIEISDNARDFLKIGEVSGSGYSSTLINYEYILTDQPNGIMYYRLKQVDFNGDYSYSKIIAIDSSGEYVPMSGYDILGRKI